MMMMMMVMHIIAINSQHFHRVAHIVQYNTELDSLHENDVESWQTVSVTNRRCRHTRNFFLLPADRILPERRKHFLFFLRI